MARPLDPEKKEKILQAAIASFLKKGYGGTTIAAVARAAGGMPVAQVYTYYAGKEELFLSAVARMMEEHHRWFRRFSRMDCGMPPERFVEHIFGELEKIRPRVLFIMRCYLTPALRPLFAEVNLDYSVVFRAYLKGMPEAGRRAVSRALMALSDSYFLVGDLDAVKRAAVAVLKNAKKRKMV